MTVFGRFDGYTITICSFFLLNICFYLTTAITDLHFVQADCDAYRHYLREDSDRYQVVWDGEPYPDFCNINFAKGYGPEYEICAEITLLDLQCGGPEVVYYYAGDIRRFTCNENGKTDKYCDDSIIYVKLDPYKDAYEQQSSSKLRINVYRQHNGNSEESSSSSGIVAAIMVPLVVGIIVVLVIVCICAKRRSDSLRNRQQNGGVMVLGNRGNMVLMAAPPDQAAQMLGNLNTPNRGQEHHQQNIHQSDVTNYPPQTQYNYPPTSQHTYSHDADQHLHDNRHPPASAPPPSYNEVVYPGKA